MVSVVAVHFLKEEKAFSLILLQFFCNMGYVLAIVIELKMKS